MPKILLVEDDPMISEIYDKKFASSGFETDTAVTGPEALKKMKENAYDLVLLDLVLPEMSGIEVLKEVRMQSGYDKNQRIAIFSNLNDQENQTEAVKFGVSGFIEKSQYNPSELVEEVRRILHMSGEQQKNSAQ